MIRLNIKSSGTIAIFQAFVHMVGCGLSNARISSFWVSRIRRSRITMMPTVVERAANESDIIVVRVTSVTVDVIIPPWFLISF
jgi:hypothetical protein